LAELEPYLHQAEETARKIISG